MVARNLAALVVPLVMCALLLPEHLRGEVTVTVVDSEVSSKFTTVAEAQHHVRSLRAAGSQDDITIAIGEGVHAPFTIGASDSGFSADGRTIYRGSGGKTKISGGTEIPPGLFKPSKFFPARWELHISGNKIHQRTIFLNGTEDELFRVRTVAAGGPDDPRHGVCKHYRVNTQNILEMSHDNRTWALAAALDCGNGWQKITSATFTAARTLLTADISSLNIDHASFGEIKAGNCIHVCATTRAMLSFNGERMVLARWPNFDTTAGRNVYAHLASGDAGSFVVEESDADVKARMLGWAAAGTGWVHGYWDQDWADCYRKIATSAADGDNGVNITFTPADTTPKHNARFYATNLLDELDAPGEFFFELANSTRSLVHMLPPPGYPSDPRLWPRGPIIGLEDPVVNMSGSRHVTLQSMQVLHSRGVGVLATDVVDVAIREVNSSLHSRQGVWLHGENSSITNCTVVAVGCGKSGHPHTTISVHAITLQVY